MAEFKTKDGKLYIDGKRVIKAWESFSGWYWFATEKWAERDDDIIWFGFVQGFFDEWGTWSEAELQELMAKGMVWEIPEQNLPYAGRRNN
jgi:hypothetical protein